MLDRVGMWPAEGAREAGRVLLVALSAGFILSPARAAKAAEGQELPDIVAALTQPAASAALPWRDLEMRLGGRWSEIAPSAAPPGLETATTVRVAQLPARASGERAKGRVDNWQITAWGTPQSASAISLRQDGTDAGAALEEALRTSGVRFKIECETAAVRHYRLISKSAGYAAHYGASSGQQEILFFLGAPPKALLRRDGCLIASAGR